MDWWPIKQKIKIKIEKIFSFWWPIRRKIINFYDFFRYYLPGGIYNFFLWFSVIFYDRQFDYVFILKILQRKFELMEKFYLKDAIIKRSDVVAKQMKICKILISRILKDEYCKKELDELDENFGELRMWGEAAFDEKTGEQLNDMCRLEISRIFADTPEKREYERKEFLRIMKLKEKRKSDDIEFLFKYITKHLTSWWD